MREESSTAGAVGSSGGGDGPRGATSGPEGRGVGGSSAAADRGGVLALVACVAFMAAAGLCSALALANAPVGPSTYSPVLTGFRSLVANGAILVLASPELLEDDHGTNYIAWELRGSRVCIETSQEAGGKLPRGVRFVVTEGSRHKPPFAGLKERRADSPYELWEVGGPVAAHSVCPLVAVRQARQGPAR